MSATILQFRRPESITIEAVRLKSGAQHFSLVWYDPDSGESIVWDGNSLSAAFCAAAEWGLPIRDHSGCVQ